MVTYIERLLDMIPDMKGTHTIKLDSIRSFYTQERVTMMTSARDINQVMWAFLVCLLGTTLFTNTTSSMDMMFFMPFQNLDLVATYDWDSCAYLYKSMDEVVCGAKRFCGFWYATLVFPFLDLFKKILSLFTDDFLFIGLGTRVGADRQNISCG